jgi:hypothetical protein
LSRNEISADPSGSTTMLHGTDSPVTTSVGVPGVPDGSGVLVLVGEVVGVGDDVLATGVVVPVFGGVVEVLAGFELVHPVSATATSKPVTSDRLMPPSSPREVDRVEPRPRSPTAEAADLKSAQCRFESDRGHRHLLAQSALAVVI